MLRELSLNFNRPEPINEEVQWAGDVLLTETSTDGIITKVNEAFTEITGYSPFEVVGKSHSIVRHPDMPKLIYKILWETITNNNSTFVGVIKNISKSGKFYWTVIEVAKAEGNSVVERYVAKHKYISYEAIKETVEPLYESLLKLERVGSEELSRRYFKNYLAKFGKDYVDFVMDILGDDSVQKERYANHQQTPYSEAQEQDDYTVFHKQKEEKSTGRKSFFEKLFS